MACVYTPSAEFQKIAKQYDVGSEYMEMALKEFMDSNNIEELTDEVYNSEKLKEFLDKYFNVSTNNLISSTAKFNTLHKIWEKRGYTTYENEQDAFTALEHFKNVFGKDNDAVKIYKNNEGKWVIKAQEPLLYNQEMADLLSNATVENGQRDTEGNLLAPNGKKSKLEPYQWAIVRTKSFIKWFGDWINDPKNASKVVDENGEPIPLVHNTTIEGITTFKVGSSHGIFAANAVGQEYVMGFERGKYDYPLFVNLKNPVSDTLEMGMTEEENDGVMGKYTVKEFISILRDSGMSNTEIKKEFPKLLEKNENELIIAVGVKNSNQVKSATSNNGEFNQKDDNIYQKISPSEKRNLVFETRNFNLDKVLSTVDTTQYNSPIFKNALSLAKQLGLKFEFRPLEKNVLGEYSNGIISIGITTTDSEFLPTLYHEVLHGVTSHILHASPENLTKEQQDAVKIINEVYEYVKNSAEGSQYGFKNIDEFIAELSNEEFRNYLKSVKLDSNKTLWDKILDFFKQIFGNALEAPDAALETIISSQASSNSTMSPT